MKLRDWFNQTGTKKGEFAKQLGILPSYLSHLINKDHPRPCPRNLAKDVEIATGGLVTKEEMVWPEG